MSPDRFPAEASGRGEAASTVETMFGGKQTFSGSDLRVTAAPGLEWIVYGFCEDVFTQSQAEEMRARAREIMGRR